MARNLDLYRRNAQVQNNPLNTISARNLKSIISQPLPNMADIEAGGLEDVLDSLLELIDKATGLDLLAWVQQVQAALQASWLSFQGLINGVLGELDKDWTDLVAALTATADDSSAAKQDWITVFEDLGLPEATAAGFATYIVDITSDVFDIFDAFSVGGTSSEFVTGVENLLNLFGLDSNSLGDATDLTEVWTFVVNDVLAPLDLFLTTASADWTDLVNYVTGLVDAIFGAPGSPSLLTYISSTAIFNNNNSLQTGWNFNTSTAMSMGGQWSWDGTVDHTGTTGSGSAKCVCNGRLNQLVGITSPVQTGQIITVTGWVQWSSLEYAGTEPVAINLITNTGPVNIGSLVSPAPSEAWTKITGSYTVVEGVTSVQMQLLVDASSGTVWFDDCEDTVTGGYLADLDTAVTELQADSTASTAAFSTLLTSILDDVEDYTNWSTFIAAVESAWNTYTTTESGLLADEIFTIQQFFDALLGLNPTTGLISSNNVQSSTGGATLSSDITAVVDDVTNIFGAFGTGNAAELTTAWDDLQAALVNTWDSLFGISTAPTSGTETIGQEVISGLTELWDWLFGTPTPSSGSAVAAAAVGPVLGGSNLGADLTTMLNNIVNSFTGSSGSQSQSALSTAVQQHAYTTAVNSQAIAALQATAVGADNSGIFYSTNFNQNPSLTGFTVSPSGQITVGTSNGYPGVAYLSSGTAAKAIFGTPTQTYYQIMSATPVSVMSFGGYFSLLGRVNSSATTFIEARIFGTEVYLYAVSSGVATLLSSAASVYQPNATYSLYCGTAISQNQFQVVRNGSPILSVTSTQALNNYSGFDFSGSGNTGLIGWSVCDNAPPTVQGSGWYLANTSTGTNYTLTSGSNLLATGFFNDPVQHTSDITAIGAGNGVSVTYAGWYQVSMSIAENSTVTAHVVRPVLYHNGSVALVGSATYVSATNSDWSFGGSFTIYCAAGDTLQGGYNSSATIGGLMTGEITGTQLWFSGALMNRSQSG